MKIHQILEAAKAYLYPTGYNEYICFACEEAVQDEPSECEEVVRYIREAIAQEDPDSSTVGNLYVNTCPSFCYTLLLSDDYIAFRDAWLERLIERAKREDV